MSLTTPAHFIQALRVHNINPATFCTHLLHTGTSGDGTIRPEDTATEFEIHRDAATHLHGLASEFDLVAYTAPTEYQVEINQDKVTRFLQFIEYFDKYATEKEIDFLAEKNIHDAELTISVPEEFEERSAELMARLIRLVRNTESELLVVTPFFTQFGVDVFVEHLAQATNHGVQVTIVTRDATGDGNNVDHIDRIRKTVSDTGEITNLQVYDYDSENGRLHAKALISDGEQAYVGSANFTNYSLKEAIEIGLIVCGPVVQELSEFFSVVQRSGDTLRL